MPTETETKIDGIRILHMVGLECTVHTHVDETKTKIFQVTYFPGFTFVIEK